VLDDPKNPYLTAASPIVWTAHRAESHRSRARRLSSSIANNEFPP
jgi:hypothetical protein